MNYKFQRNYENVQKRLYEGEGEFNIPRIAPTQYEPCRFIGFNQHKECQDKGWMGLHFFLDDYQFIRIWDRIDCYVPIFQRFACVLSPDFSLYDDFPEALQIYNHYRKHWVGAYLQEHGVKVIPTIAWSGQHSFRWCFDGEPEGGAVAVSSLGTQADVAAKELFILGYREMMERLSPETILFYGIVPEGCGGNIVHIPAYQEKFAVQKRRKEWEAGGHLLG